MATSGVLPPGSCRIQLLDIRCGTRRHRHSYPVGARLIMPAGSDSCSGLLTGTIPDGSLVPRDFPHLRPSSEFVKSSSGGHSGVGVRGASGRRSVMRRIVAFRDACHELIWCISVIADGRHAVYCVPVAPRREMAASPHCVAQTSWPRAHPVVLGQQLRHHNRVPGPPGPVMPAPVGPCRMRIRPTLSGPNVHSAG